MKFFSAALVALSSASLAVAGLVERQASGAASAVSPLTPALTPEGSPLMIQWDTTTNQAWKSMEIKFMTGSNQNMTELYTVATGIDGTSAGPGRLMWTAPNVSPTSAIYFFQFTHNGQDPTWTTRFGIADASGNLSPAPYATQPEGAAIPWGQGRIVSGAAQVSSSSSVSSPASSSASSSSASASSSSASASMSTSMSSSSTTSGSSASQTSNTSSSSSMSGQTKSSASTARVGSVAMVGCVVASLAGSLIL